MRDIASVIFFLVFFLLGGGEGGVDGFDGFDGFDVGGAGWFEGFDGFDAGFLVLLILRGGRIEEDGVLGFSTRGRFEVLGLILLEGGMVRGRVWRRCVEEREGR